MEGVTPAAGSAAGVAPFYEVRFLYNKKPDSFEPGLSVQLEGLEPSRANAHMNLNHARMPIPPQLLMKFSVVF